MCWFGVRYVVVVVLAIGGLLSLSIAFVDLLFVVCCVVCVGCCVVVVVWWFLRVGSRVLCVVS